MTTKRNRYKDRVVDVIITRFSKKGNGLGECCLQEGIQKTIEVPFTLPGDEVQAKILSKRSGKFKGILDCINRPSPNRIAPRCLHFGVCGGCRLQHLPYHLQLEEKQAIIKKLFEGWLINAELGAIIPCDPPWNYRNKMEFSFSSDSSENRYLGLMMDSSRGKVFNLTECHLCSPWFSVLLNSVRGWWEKSGLDAYHASRDRGSLRTLTLREGTRCKDKMVLLTVSGNPEYALNQNHLKGFVQAVKQVLPNEDPSIFLIIHQIAKGKPTQFYEVHLSGKEFISEKLKVSDDEMTFQISPQAFFQPNTSQSEKIYQKVLDLAEINKNDIVYDLYCGIGTLGIIASKMAKKVIGIELSPEAILDAKENAKLNRSENIEFYKGDVRNVLRNESLVSPDVVMVDPPRAGLDKKTLEIIGSSKAKKIVYVSCNPMTQAENVADLIEMGYCVKAIQPIDQFPHTVHMENIVLLCLSNS